MIDLHTHTTWSDGTLTPEQLIREAEKAGLYAIALTDHNTIAGLPDLLAAGEGSSVRVIPGTELSTEYRGTELHIVGLFIRPEHFGEVTALVTDFLRRKEQSSRDLVTALAGAGICLDYDSIAATTQDGYVNRGLIARQMVRQGYCPSVKDAFQRYLSPENGYYTPPKLPDSLSTIRFLKEIGAVAVLAHPFLNLDEQSLRGFLTLAKPAGLDGMEVAYPLHDQAQTKMAARLVEEYDLCPSGGSDFHGEIKPDIALGIGRGGLNVPDAWLDALSVRVLNADK